MKEIVQEDRGGAAAPIARCSAEKEPQAVEKPGLARVLKKHTTKQQLDVERSNWRG